MRRAVHVKAAEELCFGDHVRITPGIIRYPEEDRKTLTFLSS